jgi:hypothetical protein
MENQRTTIAALTLTLLVIGLGYFMLGFIPMVLFGFGFLGGFVLWLAVPVKTAFPSIRWPYFLTLLFFIAHKLEEQFMDFFPTLSKITGVAVTETDSPLVYLLYACAGAWLLIPFLVKRGIAFGYYLAWTFFTSMGVTELAHFLFPLFLNEPYGYFPGMATVILLAPFAWWGIFKLVKNRIGTDRKYHI